jgi:hypothetical protein
MGRVFLQSEKRPLASLEVRLNLGNTGYCVDVDARWICKLTGKLSRIPLIIKTIPPTKIHRCDARECIAHYLNPNNQNIKVVMSYCSATQEEIESFFESLSKEFASEVDITKSPGKEVYAQLKSYASEISDTERAEIRALLNKPPCNSIFQIDDRLSDFLQTPEEIKKSEELSLKLSKIITPLFEYKLPPNEKIKVYDANLNPTQMNEKELGDRFNFTFRHGLFYDHREEAYFSNSKAANTNTANTKIAAEFEQFLKTPKNYFDLMFVNNAVGYGAIANQDIPANTIIGMYSAKVMQNFHIHRNRKLEYDMSDKNFGLCSSAEVGDLTRFMNHFPKSATDNRVLCANVDLMTGVTADGFQVTYFKTNKPIKKGEMLGFDYGTNYWVTVDPLLFLRGSKPESLSLAKLTNGKIEELNETLTLPMAVNITPSWNKEQNQTTAKGVTSNSCNTASSINPPNSQFQHHK